MVVCLVLVLFFAVQPHDCHVRLYPEFGPDPGWLKWPVPVTGAAGDVHCKF